MKREVSRREASQRLQPRFQRSAGVAFTSKSAPCNLFSVPNLYTEFCHTEQLGNFTKLTLNALSVLTYVGYSEINFVLSSSEKIGEHSRKQEAVHLWYGEQNRLVLAMKVNYKVPNE